MELLAKSPQRESLIEHSVKTLNIAKDLILRSGITSNELKDIVLISSVFHDLGKCTKNFQDHLSDGDVPHLAHNVISFKMLDEFLKVCSKDVFEPLSPELAKRVIMKSVLFHHPLPNDMKDYCEYLGMVNGLTDDDLANAKRLISELAEIVNPELSCFTVSSDDVDIDDMVVNDYTYFNFEEKNNRCKLSGFLNVSNGIVRFADIIASSGESIEKYTNLCFDSSGFEFKKPDGYDDRFHDHMKYANGMKDGGVFEIFAPTGFGKTMISVLWSLSFGRKVCYVAPTNEIALSNYRSLTSEIKALGLDGLVSVGLLLTDKWLYGEDNGMFNDIVVTNIDNYSRPLFKCDGTKPMSYGFNSHTVVFDEYHQYCSKNSLMSLFQIAICGRLLCGNSKTLLMSATPNKYLYADSEKYAKAGRVKNLSVEFGNYGNKKFNCEFRDYDSEKDKSDFALVVNAVRTSQRKCDDSWMNYHSHFTKSDREAIRETLIKTHGKKAGESDKQKVVCCTNIISTGIDISFGKIIMCGLPLSEIVQVVGRCNRWGEYENGGVLVFTELYNKEPSEANAISNKYDAKLRDMEHKMLKEHLNGRTVTLSGFYEVVDKIKKDCDYDKKLRLLMKGFLDDSYKNLSHMGYNYSNHSVDDGVMRISKTTTIRTDKSNEKTDLVKIFATLPDSSDMNGEVVQLDITKKELIDNHVDDMYEYLKKNKLFKRDGGKYPNPLKSHKDRKVKWYDVNEKFLAAAYSSDTPYILSDRLYYYTKNKGLQKY